jgi:hypothetical protein
MSATTDVKYSACIYGLTDPRDGCVRYIGKTEQSLRLRHNQHVSSHRSAKTLLNPRIRWLRELSDLGLRCGIVPLESGTDWSTDYAYEREVYWIQLYRNRYRDLGQEDHLLNVARGGNGSSRDVAAHRWTPEAKLLWSEYVKTIKRNPLTEKQKARLRQVQSDPAYARRWREAYDHVMTPEVVQRRNQRQREERAKRRGFEYPPANWSRPCGVCSVDLAQTAAKWHTRSCVECRPKLVGLLNRGLIESRTAWRERVLSEWNARG